jgi:GT2 family glycosyltransferase
MAVAAIPARNEEERIEACLSALDGQEGARLDHIVLLVNNSEDGTAAIARGMKLHSATKLWVTECTLPPDQANAGYARALAMKAARKLAGAYGVLLTTDADGLVDPDWLLSNLAILKAGADAVAGWVDLHPLEWGQIPKRLHEDDARECAYDALCDEIHARIDPDPADPWPRHTQHSGASIAVTSTAFSRCGGIPAVSSGEDRAFIAALRRVDARVRHAPEVHVTVSGRTEGRAEGGMADTIRRRLLQQDEFLDERLEPAYACAHRATCRAELRLAFNDSEGDISSVANRLVLKQSVVRDLLRAAYFGMAWEAAEATAPALQRTRVRPTALAYETAIAKSILAKLRLRTDNELVG